MSKHVSVNPPITVRTASTTIHFNLTSDLRHDLGISLPLPQAQVLSFYYSLAQDLMVWIGILPNTSQSTFSLCLLVIEEAQSPMPTCHFLTPVIQNSMEKCQSVGTEAFHLLQDQYHDLAETLVQGELVGLPTFHPLATPIRVA